MSFDKMTKSPWFTDGLRIWGDSDDDGYQPMVGTLKAEDLSAVVALRNAFDVQSQRLWTSKFSGSLKVWIVIDKDGQSVVDDNGKFFSGDNPATPLLEADMWFRRAK